MLKRRPYTHVDGARQGDQIGGPIPAGGAEHMREETSRLRAVTDNQLINQNQLIVRVARVC